MGGGGGGVMSPVDIEKCQSCMYVLLIYAKVTCPI